MHEVLKGRRRNIVYIPLLALLAMVAVMLPGALTARGGTVSRQKPDDYFAHLAKSSRRGLYPRSFSGEQVYWTLVGVDGGGARSALLSEDGGVEPKKGGFSVEPFLMVDGRLLTWADVVTTQGLEEGYLPMPKVTWKAQGFTLRIEAFASGNPVDSRLHVNYTVENRAGKTGNVTLVLAVRPFQVDPPTQFLNTKGGFSPIYRIGWSGGAVKVNGNPGFFTLERPDRFIASGFASGDIIAKPGAGDLLQARECGGEEAGDPSGFSSGAMLFRIAMKPGERRTIHLLAPLSGPAKLPDAAIRDPGGWTAHERRVVASKWRAELNDVAIRAPKSAQRIADTLRTSLAFMLISRNGPALQPGTRSYARTWIRDGAMMSEALLRMGKYDIVRDFINWYTPFQFGSGKAPCCVDGRGADPAPENDSQGEFLFTVAELYRFTHDKAELEEMWPPVERAVDYMDRLRAEESTPANRTRERFSDFGLMPASISHEGYCKKPMHSYWDDFWSLKGYDDAIYLARELGKSSEARRIAASRDRFRGDLIASIRRSVRLHKIDYVPGCVELGDFDPTSATIALSPTGESAYLPDNLLKNTFERYWRDFLARRDGKVEWKDYTPYELRAVDAFLRLGRPDRAVELLDFVMKDQRPGAWNGWAEVVRRDRREPGFIGDMPHAWIASDYVRSVLDMFAYRRAADSAMVLGAGVPASWLDASGTGISGLRTPWGRLRFSMRREGNLLRLGIDSEALPPGGFILPWHYAGAPGEILQGEGKAYWRGSELHIDSAHAVVTIVRLEGEKQSQPGVRVQGE